MSQKIALLRGRTAIRDTQIYPAIDGSLDVSHPITLPPALALRWFRVKTWNVSGSFLLTGSGNLTRHAAPYDHFNLSINTVFTNYQSQLHFQPHGNEFDLIANPIFSPFVTLSNLGYDILNDPTRVAFTPSISGFTDPPITPASTWHFDGAGIPSPAAQLQFFANTLRWDGTNFFPSFVLAMQMQSTWHSDNTGRVPQDIAIRSATLEVATASNLPNLSSASLLIDSGAVSIPLYYAGPTDLDPFTDVTTWMATINDFTMDPAEFFPFQNRLGQPVYDTTSGVQINSPFA